MGKYLVIVESPAKEKTISKFLGGDYAVKSSYGHVRDLPKSKLGVNLEKDFEPQYLLVPRAKKIIPELKKISDKSDAVYLATDYDREGEAIAWHLKEALNLKDEKTKRITFLEITREAINEAVKHPRQIDSNLVHSQQARRVLDRLVGYELSPLLWHKIKYGLSAGRVQSAALRMICDREEEIKAFKPQEYWGIKAELSKKSGDNKHFFAHLASKGEKKYDKLDIKNKVAADQILNDLKASQYEVAKIELKERKRSSFPPYSTSTLQQDASRRINFYADKTMKVAQKLYEGVSLGKEGNVGLITYMRTDSLNIAVSAQKEALDFIKEKYGEKYLPVKPKVYKTKSKGAQEAHEAIRPTSVKRVPSEIKKFLSPEEFKLYDLIWRRFVASQMTDAIYGTVSVDIKAKEYIFRSSGSTLKFKGFLEVYDVQSDDEKSETLPPLNEKEILDLINLLGEQHFTEPPPRYNEASLIKALEEQGIGRPSTYASIINTIMHRTYTRLEQKRFFPTNLGIVVSDLLKKYFKEIVNIKFTAGIEEKLDLVAEGKTDWVSIVREFFTPFKKELAEAEKLIPKQKVEPQKTNEICPKCGKPMVLRDSYRSQFLACSGFPECKTTFSIDKNGKKIEKIEPEKTDIKCEKCGRPMLKRFGKRGPFLACSGFPKCRNIKKIIDNNKSNSAPEKKEKEKNRKAEK